MAGIGPTAFGLLLWGSLLGTVVVFLYEVSTRLREFDPLERG
ncbi:MAG: hypothetical protein V5A38_13060 [Halolamina sp.]